MKSPNLFVVGAMKSGSTTLHDYLAEHPQIFMSPEKEPGYFVPELWERKGDKAYHRLFERAQGEKYIGESSTHYTKLPTYSGVAERIHHFNPNSKIVYIVRHPLQRTISHYLHNRRDLSMHAENRPIAKAIAQDNTYTAYSNYAMQIRPYYELFGKENVQILIFEELVASPEKVLKELFDWLNVEPVVSTTNSKKSNATPTFAKTVRGFGILNMLRYSSLWGILSPFIPQGIKSLGNQMAEETRELAISTVENDELQKHLHPILRVYINDLEELTERNFALWKL